MSVGEHMFEMPGGGRVLFTTRHDGNLSSVGGANCAGGEQARERLRRRIGVERIARGFQEHGTVVERVTAAVNASRGAEHRVGAEHGVRADGQATCLVGVAAMVLSADCLPVALGCEGAVAALHAGWRGLAAGVLEEGVLALRELSAGEISAIVGPGAGPCCYEVGEEVHAAFAGRHRHGQNIDLRAIAHERLLAAGVAEVRNVSVCTICDERYFSHRREGKRAGRQGVVAWLS